MRAKEFLTQAKNLEAEIDIKRERIERLRSMVSGKSSRMDGMPSGGKQSDWTDTLLLAIRLENDMQADIQKYLRTLQAIEEAIDTLPDADQREILKRRYLLRQNWREIAQLMHMDTRTATRKHGRALQQLNGQNNGDFFESPPGGATRRGR